MENSLLISLKNVSYMYPDKTRAIDELSVDIREGEKVAVIGPNGAGKSTLLTLLNGVLKATGEIKISGIPLSTKTIKTIRSKIGVVFQNPEDQLFCPTLFEDIAFGPLNFGLSQAEAAHMVTQALQEVGLPGYENRSSLHLSYGEKKLASIATVLSSNPQLIALDEPSSNLDPFHRRKIIFWLKCSDRTILLASHDLDMVAETCDRVLILGSGKIVCDGPVGDILTNQQLLEQNGLELPLSLQKFPLSVESGTFTTANTAK
jgi:cobalt/nickel transport system ATP-binding protein